MQYVLNTVQGQIVILAQADIQTPWVVEQPKKPVPPKVGFGIHL